MTKYTATFTTNTNKGIVGTRSSKAEYVAAWRVIYSSTEGGWVVIHQGFSKTKQGAEKAATSMLNSCIASDKRTAKVMPEHARTGSYRIEMADVFTG